MAEATMPRRARLQRQRRNRKRKHFISKVIMFALLVLTCWLIVGQVYDLILEHLIKTAEVRYGVLEQRLPTDAIVAREETVYTAPVSGKVQLMVKEGQRVPKNFEILKLIGEGSNQNETRPVYKVMATRTGIVSFHLDGLENVITPTTILQLGESNLKQNVKNLETQKKQQTSTVSGGTPLVKIVNNIKPIVLDLNLDKKQIKTLPKEGETLAFRIPKYEEKWFMKITKINQTKNSVRIIAECNEWPNEIIYKRTIGLNVINETYQGIIVPQEAIVHKNSRSYVYKVTANGFALVDVQINGQIKGQAAVSGLEPGDEILVNPKTVAKHLNRIAISRK
ncbi:HlyD family efflux transporter periplasmic adaptor subunit [Bacillota bacterium LX-D]|nr:HlyD family efflux transporter periplasmic adaptor subunit [Bacillota bacterium LX-D]